jgi:hypothetical protein
MLMAPGSVTHGFDMSQRAIELTVSNRNNTNNTLTVSQPPNSSIAPSGKYMLFLLSNAGVPSVAKFISL